MHIHSNEQIICHTWHSVKNMPAFKTLFAFLPKQSQCFKHRSHLRRNKDDIWVFKRNEDIKSKRDKLQAFHVLMWLCMTWHHCNLIFCYGVTAQKNQSKLITDHQGYENWMAHIHTLEELYIRGKQMTIRYHLRAWLTLGNKRCKGDSRRKIHVLKSLERKPAHFEFAAILQAQTDNWTQGHGGSSGQLLLCS